MESKYLQFCCGCTYLKTDDPNSSGEYWCTSRLERRGGHYAKCDRFCEAYSRSSSEAASYFEYSKGKSSSGSGCYLTTMICNVLGMNDNNDYLNYIRGLRDSYMISKEEYKPLLVEYDVIGPQIAHSLANDPQRVFVCKAYFTKYIVPICGLINTDDYDGAINMYIEMTKELKDFYDIKQNVTQYEIDNADSTSLGHGNYVYKMG